MRIASSVNKRKNFKAEHMFCNIKYEQMPEPVF